MGVTDAVLADPARLRGYAAVSRRQAALAAGRNYLVSRPGLTGIVPLCDLRLA